MRSIYLKDVTAKKALGYVLLPGVVPRVHELFSGSFSYVAFLMAQIYNMVRLLPAGHAYLNPANIGRFTVVNVITEASHHLVISRNNIDQILIFFALLAGAILLVLQIVILGYSLLIQPAMASGYSLFATPDPTGGEVTDIAFLLLDHVFGIPDMFCTIGNQCTPVLGGSPTPFQQGLQSMFQFYSLGILMIAVLIFLYFIVVITVETATTGTPFGQRFQNVWVPIRLVMAIGLLVPINYGYSSGQYMAFYAAKWGSSLGTNGWNAFNQAVAAGGNANPTGEKETLIAKPEAASIEPLIQAMSLIHTCAYAYQRAKGWNVTPNLPARDYNVKAFLVKSASSTGPAGAESIVGKTFEDAANFSDGGAIRVRFGIQDSARFKEHPGGVEPTCGEVQVPVHNAGLGGSGNKYDDPLSRMSMNYYKWVNQLWYRENELVQFAQRMVEIRIKRHDNKDNIPCNYGKGSSHLHQSEPECYQNNPKASFRSNLISVYQPEVERILTLMWSQLTTAAPYELDPEIKDRGWGGAGIWYNKIAQMNGAFISTVFDVPSLTKYPLIMEKVRESNRATNTTTNIVTQFQPYAASPGAGSNYVSRVGTHAELDIARVLYETYVFWNDDSYGDISPSDSVGANFLLNAVNLLLGTSGLFDMRDENAYTHPMAQLVALGKGLVESSVRNMGVSTALSFSGGIVGAVKGLAPLGHAASAFAGLLNKTAFLGLTAGFILFYIIPFLPFIYVFFAVGNWVKGIFEAMVGIPLWALAHLRIDGEGLPGDSAQNGYFLIFEIALRPILTVFGLVAAVTIFSAEVRVLNFIWDLVLYNLGGFSDAPSGHPLPAATALGFKRSSVDELFFTIIYAIVVYMMATGSFKLIDRIPQGILRWSAFGSSAYADINQEQKDGLQRYAALGGISVGQQITGSIQQTSGQLGGVLGKAMNPPPQQ